MCTALSRGGYFGRTLDLEGSFGEWLTAIPRGFPMAFAGGEREEGLALVGVAHLREGYPLLYDGMNERGLWGAALSFPGRAVYGGKGGLAPYEVLPMILRRCGRAEEVRGLLEGVEPEGRSWGGLPLTPLHWIFSDGEKTVAAEPLEGGIRVFDDPVGVLSNSPEFTRQMERLADFARLSPRQPEDFFPGTGPYSRGMGAMGLPGDWSSSSRFVRGAYLLRHWEGAPGEMGQVGRMFHALDNLSVPAGCVETEEGKSVLTQYASCCSRSSLTCFCVTAGRRRMAAMELVREGRELRTAPLGREEDPLWEG